MYKLRDIVKEWLIENGDTQLNKFARINTIATSGLRELAFDISAVPKSKKLPINDNDSVDLPAGFVNYISISLVGADGRLHGLGKNTKIDLSQHFNNCGAHIRPNPNKDVVGDFNGFLGNTTYIAQHYRNGENFGSYSNAGGVNRIGHYRIDYATNKIVLGALNINATSVILEYICDIEADNEDYVVHPFIINALKSWIDWKMGKADESSYERARKKAVHRFNSGTMQEWIDSVRSGVSGVAKF